jgi:hypothetical protein
VRPIAGSRERDRAPRGPLIPPWVVIGVVLVGVVVALAVIGGGGGKNPPPASANTGRTQRHHAHRHHHRKPPPPQKPKTVTLQLTPTGTVYVCLVNGDGRKLIPGQIFSAGQTIPSETAQKLLLTLGNASVTMKVNGSTFNVAASPNAIGLLIQPTGTTRLSSGKQPTCA